MHIQNFIAKLYFSFFLLSVFNTKVFAEIPNLKVPLVSTQRESKDRLKKELTRIDIKFGIDLFKISEGGVGLNSKYNYQVKPAYRNRNFLRSDKWSLGLGINAGSYLEEIDAPFFVSIGRSAAVHYHRQFEKQIDALKAWPQFSFKNIPINADLAKNRMQQGTLVEIPMNLSFAVGAQTAEEWGVIEAKASAAYISSGNFLVQFYKLRNDKIRVRLIAQKSNGLVGNAGIRFFELVDYKYADDVIDRVFMKKIIEIGGHRLKGKIFFSDMVFDLNSPDAREAYDNFFSGGFRFATEKIFNPISNEIDLSKMYYQSFEMAEKISIEDASKPDSEKRIKRVFKAISDFVSSKDFMDLGGAIAGYRRDSDRDAHEITSWNEDNSVAEFVLANSSKRQNKKLLWGRISEGDSYTLSILSDENSNDPKVKDDLSFSDLIFTNDQFDKTLRNSERKNLLVQLDRHYPRDLLYSLPFADLWKHEKLTNLRVFYRTVFHENFDEFLKTFSQRELDSRLEDWVDSHNGSRNSYEAGCFEMGIPFFPNCPFKKSVERTEFLGSWTGRKDLDVKDSFKFLRLRNSQFFRNYGQGYLLSLIPAEMREDLVSHQVEVDAFEFAPRHAIVASAKRRDEMAWFSALSTLQNIVSQGGIDLRLLDEEFDN